MASVHDVAAYILAWSLVWDEEPLFPERIEAWTNGPVVPELYRAHKGKFKVASWPAEQLAQDD